MTQRSIYFDDAAAYEAFMARWSRKAGRVFLDWISPSKNARWLDIGCGTGIFTDLILATASPAAVSGVDPTRVHIEHARRSPAAKLADFQIADAQALPFPDDSFDFVVSALVINFIPEPARALAEMRRVGRPGGTIAGYVWDFAGERSPGTLVRTCLNAIGVELAALPGSANSRVDELQRLFKHAGLEEIATRSIDVSISFPNFDNLWRAQTPKFGPIGKAVENLSGADRARLVDKIRETLPPGMDGSVSYSVRAHAIKGRIALAAEHPSNIQASPASGSGRRPRR
jgi:ubiquinone/menaquinone biosynthesis C-methylase UbiE